MKEETKEQEYLRICQLSEKERVQEYRHSAELAWDRVWEILNDPDGWRVDKGRDLCTGVVHSKHYTGEGRCFKMQGYVDCSPEQLVQFLVTDVERVPEWNTTCLQSEVLQSVDDNIQIHYTLTKEVAGGLISKRDFVNLLHRKSRNDVILNSSIGTCHTQRPAVRHVVRAENRPSGVAFKPVAGDSSRCILVWLANIDLGGWLPQWTIDQVMSGELLGVLRLVRQRFPHLQS